MDVVTHEMDTRIARIHYGDYRKRVRAHREKRMEQLHRQGSDVARELNRVRVEKTKMEKEDEELLTAYKALAGGERIVILPEALKKAGISQQQLLPNLAISKADAEWVYFDGRVESHQMHRSVQKRNGYRAVSAFSSVRGPYEYTTRNSIFLPLDTYPAEIYNESWRDSQRRTGNQDVLAYPAKAMVPKVPPKYMPDDLAKYYILFEPKWEKEPPHLDPILLSRASETVFIVVAVWDMTPLEASILGVSR